MNGTTIPTVTNSGYAAKIAVDDDNYDWTGIEGYANGYYTATVNVTITAAEHDTSDLKFEGATFEYDGKEHSIEVTGLPDGVTVSYEGNKQVNAGTYTVTAKFTVDGNHEHIADMTATLKITAKEVTLVWTAPANLEYDGTAKVPTVVAEGLVEGDNCTVTAALTGGADNVNVGTFTYTATGLSNANYKLPANVVSPEYTITAKEVTLAWTAPANLEYDGTAKVPTVVAGGLVEGDNCTVTAALTGGADNVNVGTFTYTATGLSNANYKLPANVVSPEYTITAAEHDTSDLKFEGATVTYDGKEHSIEVTGLPEGVTVSYEGNKQVNAGIYTVTAKFTVDGNHAPIADMTATLVISQRDISNVTLTIYGSYQYTGKPVQPDWSISDSAAITEKDYAMALVNNTYAGVATLVVTGTRNYCGSASVTFDILKAPPVVGEIAAQGSHIYGVTLDEISLTASGFTGLAAGARPEWVDGATVPTVTNEGYAAKIAVDDDNYDWTNVAGYADGCYTVAVDADIQKAPVTELPQPPVIKDELEEGEEVGNIELPEGWEWVDPEDKPTVEEGEEGIEVKIPVDDDNYDWTDIEGYDPEDGTYTDKVQVPVKEPQPEYGVIDIDLPATGAQSYEYGTSLKDIALVAGSLQGAAQGAEWEWAEESPSSVYPGVENAGYDVRIAVDTTNYDWTDVAGYADGYYTVHVNVSIYARDIAVSWSGTSFTYSGEARQPLAEVGAEQLVGNDKLQFAYTIAGEKVTDGKAINAGSYTVTASIDDANYTIASGSECAFTIARAVVEIPASGGEIESNGEEQEFFPEGFDGDIMDIEGNRVTEGGDYDAEISLKDPDNYEWSDGTTDSKQIGFTVVGDDYIDLLWLIILFIVLIVIELILLILIIRRRKEIDDGDDAKGGSSRTESMMAGAPIALLAVKVIPWQIATIAVLAVIFVALAIADIVLFAAARRAEKESGLDDIVDENDIQG